jgi:hypothetical protein
MPVLNYTLAFSLQMKKSLKTSVRAAGIVSTSKSPAGTRNEILNQGSDHYSVSPWAYSLTLG